MSDYRTDLEIAQYAFKLMKDFSLASEHAIQVAKIPSEYHSYKKTLTGRELYNCFDQLGSVALKIDNKQDNKTDLSTIMQDFFMGRYEYTVRPINKNYINEGDFYNLSPAIKADKKHIYYLYDGHGNETVMDKAPNYLLESITKQAYDSYQRELYEIKKRPELIAQAKRDLEEIVRQYQQTIGREDNPLYPPNHVNLLACRYIIYCIESYHCDIWRAAELFDQYMRDQRNLMVQKQILANQQSMMTEINKLYTEVQQINQNLGQIQEQIRQSQKDSQLATKKQLEELNNTAMLGNITMFFNGIENTWAHAVQDKNSQYIINELRDINSSIDNIWR